VGKYFSCTRFSCNLAIYTTPTLVRLEINSRKTLQLIAYLQNKCTKTIRQKCYLHIYRNNQSRLLRIHVYKCTCRIRVHCCNWQIDYSDQCSCHIHLNLKYKNKTINPGNTSLNKIVSIGLVVVLLKNTFRVYIFVSVT